MTINEAYHQLKKSLSKIYAEKEAGNIADLVIEKISGLNQINRILNRQLNMDDGQAKLFLDYNNQLLSHKPVQYILNEAWFAGMKFYVDENVLIPRPETEELVEWISTSPLNIHQSPFTILDIGTGSGCIAISLKKKLKNATIHAVDISESALRIAELNARQHNAQIQFYKENILQPYKTGNSGLFDVIVSNPPYITNEEAAEMNANVLLYEPHVALFVPGNDPLLFYKNIITFAESHLKKNGWLYFEINENFANEIAVLLKEKKFHSIQIKKDLQSKNRMLKACYNI